MADVVFDIPDTILTGVETEFSIATANVGEDEQGTMVVGKSEFPEGDYDVWYKEGEDWIQFTESDTQFGPSTGFPLQDATSYFKVLFREALGEATLTVHIVGVDSQEDVATGTATVNVITYDADYVNALIAQGGDVTVEYDIEGGLVVPADVSVAIDLGGCTVSSADTAPLTVNGIATVTNGTLASTGSNPALFVSTSGNCTIEGGTYTSSAWYAVQIQGACTMTDGSIVCTASNSSAVEVGFDMDRDTDSANFSAVGDDSYVATYTMDGGSVDGQYLGIKCDEHGRVRVTDGTVTAVYQAILNWNQTQITGGTFTSTSSPTVIANGVYNESAGTVVIADGTFTASAEGDIIAGTEGYSDGIVYTVFGGEFSPSAPASEYLAEGYETATDSDGNVVVQLARWEYPEGGPQGGGLNGYKRLVMHKDVYQYEEGGLAVPTSFLATAVISASAVGGIIPYLDTENAKVVLYQNGAEVSGSLEDVTIVLIGRNQ